MIVWLLFNAKWAIFCYVSWEEQVKFLWDDDDDDDAHFVQDRNTWIFIVLSSSLQQLFAGRHAAQLKHIILILNQPVFPLTS